MVGAAQRTNSGKYSSPGNSPSNNKNDDDNNKAHGNEHDNKRLHGAGWSFLHSFVS